VSCTLRARPEAAPQARHALAGLALAEATRENLALVVTELVTNVVRHAGLSASDTFSVQLTNSDRGLRLAVHDGGRGFPAEEQAQSDDLLGTGGRGLVIVAALSDAWGVDSDEDGCTVWCEMPASWPAESGAAALVSGYADVFSASAAGLPA
jgi:two-component sensor histidine kinase